MTTYSAHTEPGQGITFPDCKIVKGFAGIVKRGEGHITRSGLFGTKAAALRWATAKAKEHRDFRQANGEGIEDGVKRRALAKEAERRLRRRISDKAQAMFDLLRPIVSDMELVRAELPAQAITRIEKAAELIAFIDTDQS